MSLALSSTFPKDTSKVSLPDCFHCGLPCLTGVFKSAEKSFCCQGCVNVFDLLNDQGLQGYYEYESYPGSKQFAPIENSRYLYLDDEEFQNNLFDFKQEHIASITFKINQIHCSSCVWLLEKSHKLHKGILKSRVNFLTKTMQVTFDLKQIKLSRLVILLCQIGYEPEIKNPHSKNDSSFYHDNKKLLIQTGLAGFCFGNVMLFSFPEYLSDEIPLSYSYFFAVCTFLISLPVVFYSGQIWFKGAIHALKQKMISMDLPISIGISVLFIVSSINIFYYKQIGYLDSLCAFIFFLLLARLFQSKTFHLLSFEREINHFFPLYAMVNRKGEYVSCPLSQVQKGDHVFVRHGEVVSTSGKLISSGTLIDYSFITGESDPVEIKEGESISIGGRVIGSPATIEVEVVATKAILNSMWSSSNQNKTEINRTLNEKISPYFVGVITFVAIFGFFYSYLSSGDFVTAMMVLACVFIVTCPCALAINGPLVQGLMVRYLSSFGVYIKDGRAIELAADTSHVVFDKTGTLTEAQKKISVLYENMTEDQTSAVVATMNGSMHPVCTALLEKFKKSNVPDAVDFKEHIGNGISAKVNGVEVRVGRYTWLQEFMVAKPEGELDLKDSTAILLDGKLVAAYGFHEKLRFTVGGLIKDLAKHFQLSLISGDHNESIKEKSEIKDHIKETRFKLNPQEKADYIRNLKKDGNKVLMVGDGLNDAGALSSSHIGVAVLEEKMNFCPASDVIIEGDKLKSLGLFLNASKFGKRLIKVNMAISLIYNLFGISIAISGVLTPLFVAILMPLSRLSILVSSVLGVQWFSRRGLEWK